MDVKFQCQPNCGKCCVSHGSYGFVYLTEEDMISLEMYLGRPRHLWAVQSDFEYTRRSNGKPERAWHIDDRQNMGRCRFLGADNKCTVYEARPTQCRTFPFWPENMNPKAWGLLKEFCPGIDKGETLNPVQVSIVVTSQRMADAVKRTPN